MTELQEQLETLSDVPTQRSSWSEIKARYRQAERPARVYYNVAVAERPLSAVTFAPLFESCVARND